MSLREIDQVGIQIIDFLLDRVYDFHTRERSYQGCRQLDGKRHASHHLADALDKSLVARAKHDRRVDPSCTFDKKIDRLIRGITRRITSFGKAHSLEIEYVLTRETEASPRGG